MAFEKKTHVRAFSPCGEHKTTYKNATNLQLRGFYNFCRAFHRQNYFLWALIALRYYLRHEISNELSYKSLVFSVR